MLSSGLDRALGYCYLWMDGVGDASDNDDDDSENSCVGRTDRSDDVGGVAVRDVAYGGRWMDGLQMTLIQTKLIAGSGDGYFRNGRTSSLATSPDDDGGAIRFDVCE